MNYATAIVLLIIPQIFVNIGDALRCYECTGTIDKDCYSPINKTSVETLDCRNSSYVVGTHNGSQYQCVSYLERYNNTNATLVGRHCFVKKDKDFCKSYTDYRKNESYTVEECASCSTDDCNSGQESKLHFVLLGFLSTVQVLIKIQFFDYV